MYQLSQFNHCSNKHYYTEADIMQAGQSCLDYTPLFTNWDHTRQKDHPDTVKDKYGVRCADRDDPITCPLARRCVDDSLCPADLKEWTDFDDLYAAWGPGPLAAFADPINLDELPEGEPVPQPTFNAHRTILNSDTAWKEANWPYISMDYKQRYTIVDWTVDKIQY